ncbi:MAG: ABC transporter permease [Mariniblastus sp.]
MHPILAITLARLREFVRRPEAVFWVYFFPVLMVVVLGVAFRNKPVESFAVDILEGPIAAEIVEKLEPETRINLTIVSESESLDRLRTSKTSMLVLGSTSLDNVEYKYDPVRPGSLAARNLVDSQLQKSMGRKDVIQAVDVEFDEPGSRYVDFLVPGLLAMGLMGGGLWGVGFAIVDMRIRKLLKRFMATPMKRTHFLMGMMTSRLIFMIPQIVVLLLFSYLIFGVTIHGNWASIILVVIIGAIEFAGIGLLVAARAQTLETVSGLMNLVMLPMWTLSGIFFSYEQFPEVVHPLIKLLPLTPLIDALRALMMDGKSIMTLGPELAVMIGWSIIPFVIALVVFRWND